MYFVPNLPKDALNAFQLASLEIPYNNKFPQYCTKSWEIYVENFQKILYTSLIAIMESQIYFLLALGLCCYTRFIVLRVFERHIFKRTKK